MMMLLAESPAVSGLPGLGTLGFWTPGWPEMLIILVIALLLFGRRLPEVGRSLGKGIVEFRKGVKGIEDDLNEASSGRSGGSGGGSSSSSGGGSVGSGERKGEGSKALGEGGVERRGGGDAFDDAGRDEDREQRVSRSDRVD